MSSDSTRLFLSPSGTSPLMMRWASPRRWRSCRRRGADQHRVVLDAALQYLDGAADFVIPADHRVELAEFGPLGGSDGAFQRLAVLLGVGIRPLTSCRHGTLSMAASSFSLVGPQAQQLAPGSRFSSRAASTKSSDEMRLILALLASLSQTLTGRGVGEPGVPFHPADAGQAVQLAEARAQGIDVEPGQVSPADEWIRCPD